MRFVERKKPEYNITEDYLYEFEKMLGACVPPALREFYLKYNGAGIQLCIFSVDEYEYEISEMLPLKFGKCCVEKIHEDDVEDGYIRESLIPFANNQGGDYYYWDKYDGKIYLLYCDDIETEIPIAQSIDELFDVMNCCV